MLDLEDGKLIEREVPALTAINMRLRDDYVRDAAGGMGRWNKIIAKAGGGIRIKASPSGLQPQDRRSLQAIISTRRAIWSRARRMTSGLPNWLPTQGDGDFHPPRLMQPCYEPGKYASWIAPPKVGIDNKPGDFEYVQTAYGVASLAPAGRWDWREPV